MAEAHAHWLHHHFDDVEQQRESNLMGMWTFLATELLMFSGLFFTYTLYRWKITDGFIAGSHRLNFWLGFINTMVLLVSSFTVASGVYFAGKRNRKMLVTCLIATWILGASFIGIKAVEWTQDYHEGIVPSLNWHPEPKATDTPEANPAEMNSPAAELARTHMQLFMCVYFCMTGLHAFHMIAGLLVVGWMTYLSWKGLFTTGNDQPIEIVGLYWHFIDIVWVFLFPLLYLITGK